MKPRTAVSLLLAIVAVCISSTAALFVVDSRGAAISPTRVASRAPYSAIPVDGFANSQIVIVTQAQAADRGIPILPAPRAFTVAPAGVLTR
jgi:hypothetical protein